MAVDRSEAEPTGAAGQSHLAYGEVLWRPSQEQLANSRMEHYRAWLARERSIGCQDYSQLQRWSTSLAADFWHSIVEYFQVRLHSKAESILSGTMPNARWFEGATLSYAERALGHPAESVAVIAVRENGERQTLTYGELSQRVSNVAAGLRQRGVQPGDRVAGYLPNDVHAVVAFLACASVGAIWSSCPPEFGVQSVLDRFAQISPKVLFAVTGYEYGGKSFDRLQAVRQIAQGLPSLVATVIVDQTVDRPDRISDLGVTVVGFSELQQGTAPARHEIVPFEHPLWILYSSGTTGLPKALVHGHGGIVLEHLKMLSLHGDIGPGDRFFWFSTTGWMMWNYLVSGLLVGATIVLYDGNPGYPSLNALWRMAAAEKITHFGVSAAYLLACRKAGLEPIRDYDLSALKNLGSTGSPLPIEGFDWVYQHVKRDLLLGSISGGTDLCTAFVGQCPTLPVRAGEIQCRALGADVQAFDDMAQPVIDQVGELVITQPMPSMPLFLWGDSNGEKYHASYFEMFPGIWRHGDWIKFTDRGSCVIYGRSDSTLNRGGVRIGTSELYRVVEGLPEISDSLVVDTSHLEQEGKLWLFVVLAGDSKLDNDLKGKIVSSLRTGLSPRHVPDEIHQIEQVPRTLSGKKLEVPIKRILAGTPVEQAVNPGTLQDPGALFSLLTALGLGPSA